MNKASREYDEATHTYRIGGRVVESVTQVLTRVGLVNTEWFTENARARGQAVHAACHYLDEGDLDRSSVHPEVEGYVRSWEAFKARTGLDIIASEMRVWDEPYEDCGTLDRVVRMYGGLWVLDLKTVGLGKGQPPAWTRYQVGAYEHMYRKEHGGPRSRRGAIVLQADASLPKLVEYPDDADYYDFLALSTTAKILRRHNRERRTQD